MKTYVLAGATVMLCAVSFASGQWVNFANETLTRMPVGAGLNTAATSTQDPEEKDYAWGDVDQDGDIDLVCVRKQPFTTSGRKPNILFMNEGVAQGHVINGVLVDRTAQYAKAVDMNNDGITDPQPATDQGFETPTNDRDVALADVNNDGWLDIITCTTLSNGQPKHIGHPRVYMNLKDDINGAWQGFRYEPDRFPTLHPTAQPSFCGIAAGDVTGDGYVDLYFADYSSSAGGSFDFNNRLIINRGAAQPGYFDDSGTSRISAGDLASAFGSASAIADMNNDGALDAVKQSQLGSPAHIAIHHNNPANVGFFPSANFGVVYTGAGYFVSTGELNNDGRMDLIISDDAQDRYLLNTTTTGAAVSTFTLHSFSTDGNLASQSATADLNNDGWNDVLISDVDVDIPGCGGRLLIHRNLGNAPNVTLQEQAIGGLNNSSANMGGTHNIAPFDINGDGWIDLVIGRCQSTAVWINVPPVGINFTFPDGLLGFVTPEQATAIDVQLTGISGAQLVPNSGRVFISIDGGAFVQSAMTPLGGNLYSATLPAVPCTSQIRYYFSGELQAGGAYFNPPSAPNDSYLALSALGTELAFEDTIEGSVAGWSISNGPGLTAGTWEQADPNDTFFNAALAAPENDATSGLAVKAFVTFNGPPENQTAGLFDVDGGATYLVSPVIDLADSDATISYSRWFFTSVSVPPVNSLTTEVSNNNGATWHPVHSVTTTIADGTTTVWQTASFVVGAFVTPTSEVRVRFVANGPDPAAVVEAGIDNFRVEQLVCEESCPADIDHSGTVEVNDMLAVITGWGPCPVPPAACPADINHSGAVEVHDLLAVITGWGACP